MLNKIKIFAIMLLAIGAAVMNTANAEEYRMIVPVQEPETQATLRRLFIMPDATTDQRWITQNTRDIRRRFLRYSK